jgi:hypothetical protein
MDNKPISNSLYSIGYVSTNVLQERINRSYACSWFGMNLQIRTKPPLWFWNKEEMRQVSQKGSTIEALTHKKWTNKLMDLK